MDAQVKWLVFEGLLPMFGAGVLFAIWGISLAVVKGTLSSQYAWREAIDSIGWMYGALIIAIQSALRSFSAKPEATGLAWGCIIAAAICFIMLLAAMNQRGLDNNWRPPLSLKLVATMLVIAVLVAGYASQGQASSPSSSDTTAGKERDGGKK